MSNASTVRRQVAGTQQLTLAPLAGSTITTTATAFTFNNNGLTATGGGVTPLQAGTTGLYAGTGAVLHLRATGVFSGESASGTIKLQLYQIPNSLLPIANTLAGQQTFTSWNQLTAGSADATSTAQGSWMLDARLQMDAAFNLMGHFYTETGGVVHADAAINGSAVTSGVVAGLTGEVDLNFAIVITLGTTTTGVIITMDEFALDLE